MGVCAGLVVENADGDEMSHNKKGADWEKLNKIFAGAARLAGTEQKDFLKNVANGDEDLRLEVEAILAASNRAAAQDFLEADAFAAGARVLAANGSNKAPIGKRIGDYIILREIGRGGMGAIYLAEREDFHQRVALKIIKRGMDTDEIVRRFEREREVLASLNHPNIARLLDGGTTDDGLPFLVMEYVEGSTITEFCGRNSLNIEARLELFRKVCGAVAFAHQNLIVHRDLKPSNILVNNEGEPKLLDFGIARLLAPDKPDQTTETGFRLLTPEYASPEQIRGERVTTSSDVYSLGVLLYELLTGQKPYEITSRNAVEIIRAICETAPERPSSVLSSPLSVVSCPSSLADERLTEENEGQRTQDEGLKTNPKYLKGDLDNIILKALRKEVSERYSSVEQFAEDVRRHLVGLPVVARPATLGYQFAKFVERNRTSLSFAGIALIALFAGLSFAVWQAYVSKQERARAERQATETRRLANSLLSEYDEELLNLPGSYPIRIKLMKASSDYLDRLAQEANDPSILKELAEAHAKLGAMYGFSFGNETEAQRHYQTALELSRRVLDGSPDNPAPKELVAEILVADEYDTTAREGKFREAIALREEVVRARVGDLDALDNLSGTYLKFGAILKDLDRRTEAFVYFNRAIETRYKVIALLEKEKLSADEYSAKFWALAWIGLSQGSDFEDWNAAAPTLRQGLETAEAAAMSFPDHQRTQTNVPTAHSYLARSLDKIGDYRGAFEHYEIALDLNKKAAVRFNLFWHHSQTRHLLKIAEMLQKLGQTEQSVAKLREALELRREATAVNHAHPGNRHVHAEVFLEAGKLFAVAGFPDEALAAYREAEEVWRQLSEIEQQGGNGRLGLARVNMHIGDIYANCPPDEVSVAQTNRARLEEATKKYQKSVQIYAENQTRFTALTNPQEKLARAKLAACQLKLRKADYRTGSRRMISAAALAMVAAAGLE